MWDFGQWADQVYSQLRIHPLTREGLAPHFATGQGRNQGDSFASEGFQATQRVLNAYLPVPPDGLPLPDTFCPSGRVSHVDGSCSSMTRTSWDPAWPE